MYLHKGFSSYFFPQNFHIKENIVMFLVYKIKFRTNLLESRMTSQSGKQMVHTLGSKHLSNATRWF